MGYDKESQDSEESTEASGSPQDQRQRVVLESLGMALVRSSLAGDSPCFIMYPHSTRKYDASEDFYLININ